MTRRRVVVSVAVEVGDVVWQVSAALDGTGEALSGAVLTVGGPVPDGPWVLYCDRQRRIMTTEQRVPVDAMLAAVTALRSGPICDRLTPAAGPRPSGLGAVRWESPSVVSVAPPVSVNPSAPAVEFGVAAGGTTRTPDVGGEAGR